MEYNEFKDMVTEIISKEYPKSSVNVESFQKNNNVRLDALIIRSPSDSIAAPTIYLEPYYRSFEDGMDFDRIISDIKSDYEKYRKVDVECNLFSDGALNLNAVRPYIIFRLVNAQSNEELLNRAPHRIVHNLAMVYHILLNIKCEGEHYSLLLPDADTPNTASTLIEHKVLDSWNLTEEDLYHLAMENTPRLLPYDMADILSIIRDMIQESNDCNAGNLFDEDDSIPMWVVTNRTRYYGAGSLMYPGVLSKCAGLLGNFYVLPSSIHEVILIPANRVDSDMADHLQSMVYEINRQDVSVSDRLSDEVYFYDCSTGELTP